jgi:hypothetical protein
MNRKLLAAVVAVVAVMLGILPGRSMVANAAAATATVIAYQSTGWKYQQVDHGGVDGFQSPSFDDSGWATGQAAFGSVDPPSCTFNDPSLVHTNWDVNTDMLIRRHFTAPAGTTSLHLEGTVDNNADIYLNGVLLQHVDSGFCATGAIDVDIPASDLTGDNVLAIRGVDEGVADYLDVQLTAFTQFNEPPAFTSYPAGTVYPATQVGGAVTFQVAATDPEGEPVTFNWTPLPTRPSVTCDDNAVPTPPATGAIVTCTVTTTTKNLTTDHDVIFSASDPEGQTSSVTVTIGGGKNFVPSTSNGKTVVLAEAVAVNTSDKLQVHLDSPGDEDVCGGPVRGCQTQDFAPSFVINKAKSIKVTLHDLTARVSCDSSTEKAAHIIPIEPPPGNALIGYEFRFDARCGKGASVSYDGIELDVYFEGSAPQYNYSAGPSLTVNSGFEVANNLNEAGRVNGLSCFTASQLDLIGKVLTVRDLASLTSEDLAEVKDGVVGLVGEEYAKLIVKPIAGTTSCDAARMYGAAALAVQTESLYAAYLHTQIQFRDQLVLNGKKSQYRIWVFDPAGFTSNATQGLLIVNLSGSENEMMNARGNLEEMPRSSA